MLPSDCDVNTCPKYLFKLKNIDMKKTFRLRENVISYLKRKIEKEKEINEIVCVCLECYLA